MRSTFLFASFVTLGAAIPRPQDIGFDLVDAAPDPTTVTPPIDVVSAAASTQPAAVATSAANAAVTETAESKRAVLDGYPLLSKRDGNCAAQPAGTGPPVHTPADDIASFLNYAPFHAAAVAAALPAAVPQGYSLSFSDLKGSSQTVSYLGLTTLNSYDPVSCASYCDQHSGCIAFNLYFERDPTLDANKISCPNPASLTNIKCVRWGVHINATTATNTGQWRDSFQVVISGSNGYNKNLAPSTIPGFVGPTELGGAINAPLDPITNTNTYMGYKYFSFATVQTYAQGVTSCTTACTAQTAYNARHPPSSGYPSVCNQVVVYVLSDENQPQGVYCAMYSQEWASNYATNAGQWRGSDWWGVSQAYAYTTATYASKYQPICAIGGCPSGSYRGGNCGGYGPGVC